MRKWPIHSHEEVKGVETSPSPDISEFIQKNKRWTVNCFYFFLTWPWLSKVKMWLHTGPNIQELLLLHALRCRDFSNLFAACHPLFCTSLLRHHSLQSTEGRLWLKNMASDVLTARAENIKQTQSLKWNCRQSLRGSFSKPLQFHGRPQLWSGSLSSIYSDLFCCLFCSHNLSRLNRAHSAFSPASLSASLSTFTGKSCFVLSTLQCQGCSGLLSSQAVELKLNKEYIC